MSTGAVSHNNNEKAGLCSAPPSPKFHFLEKSSSILLAASGFSSMDFLHNYYFILSNFRHYFLTSLYGM